ncbi:transcriptional coactivator/pterin dehydratase [Parathielavia appendiculata]|uniref:4a-hydroxytetrahydrobiopterin dehydratase n=1 Tax=Parathielavia appendiculata TaxID=2587402 RepID=A0AAN6Z5S4_9PEZI|nr:transcriptional coactivator/pterin dehydratase [Parathielavia appendiculata]
MRPSRLSRVSPASLAFPSLKRSTQDFIPISRASSPLVILAHRQSSSPLILTRILAITTAHMSTGSKQQPRFSAGSDLAALESTLSPLLTSNGGRWNLTMDGEALEREFKFKTFAKTWDFMTAVSLQCKIKNHHPEWSNVFNTTFIRWTTHHPKGLSAKDIELAAQCDQLAQDFGEVAEQEQQSTQPSPSQPTGRGPQQQQQQQTGGTATCGLAGLAARAVGSAGDCCVPRK